MLPTPKRTYTVKPNPDCKACHGSGKVVDLVDYGNFRVPMSSTCECVYDALYGKYPTLDNENYELVIDLSDWTGPVVPVDMEP